MAFVVAAPVLPWLPRGAVEPLVAASPVTPSFGPVLLSGVPVLPGEAWTGGLTDLFVPSGEVTEPAVGADVEDEVPPAPPPLLPEPPPEDCAHAAPAVRQAAVRAAGKVR